MRSIIFLAALATIPAIAGAQTVRTLQPQSPTVPPSMMPPAGKCRIWMEGVAPAQQPAPTDCQTALRQRPSNGVVVFGPSTREDESNGFRGRPAATPSRTDSAPEPRRPSDSREPARRPTETREPTRTPSRDSVTRRAPETRQPRRDSVSPPTQTKRPSAEHES